MSLKAVRKAIFPVAGLGTRFLPATKANPKEMLPIVDKPLIQYAVEEALAAGITELIFVTSSAKRAIEDHFDRNMELEAMLERQGKEEQLKLVRDILPEGVTCAYVRQSEPKGLGHAILCARALVGHEPFAVLLADDLIDGYGEPCLSQMLRVYHSNGGNIIASQKVEPADVVNYGIIAGENHAKGIKRVSHIVEKPSVDKAPSQHAVIGRYIFQSNIFDYLAQIEPGKNGEIQLTDAIAQALKHTATFAYEFAGQRFDCGSKLGYIEATLAYALKDPAIGPRLLNALEKYDYVEPLLSA